jgi:urease accessory protein UreF
VKLVPLGQKDGQEILFGLQTLVKQLVEYSNEHTSSWRRNFL